MRKLIVVKMYNIVIGQTKLKLSEGDFICVGNKLFSVLGEGKNFYIVKTEKNGVDEDKEIKRIKGKVWTTKN